MVYSSKCMGRKHTEDKNISRISTNLTSKIFSTWTKQITHWFLVGLRKNLLFENILILLTKSAKKRLLKKGVNATTVVIGLQESPC